MNSEMFKLKIRDILVGLGLAIGGAVFVAIQGALTSNSPIDWNLILKVAESAFVMYITKNFFSNSEGKIAGKF